VVNLQSGARRRLTNDLTADLEPAWSPDGRTIAFVTDRFGTNLDNLTLATPRLATIEPDGSHLTALATFDDGKSVDPQWAPDGKSLYFVSDHGGISNVYRVGVDGGAPRQITNLRSGVSGITPLGPAISVARQSGRLVFTAYVKGNFALYSMEPGEALEGRDPVIVPHAAVLPPVERKDDQIAELDKQPELGLAAADTIEERAYHSRLSIDRVSQLGLGVGAGANGTAIGGGTTLFWSDMMGRHTLATLLQVSNTGGSFGNNIAAVGQYQNRVSRWNWGVAGGQIPYLDRAIFVDGGTLPSGEPVTREQDFRFWQIDRELQGTLQYPFSRVARVEMSGGFRQIAYESEVQTRIWSDVTGNLISDNTVRTDSFPTVNLAVADIAFVYDNSLFGGTSPILGQRYRLEATPVVGDLHFVGALADYRRYVMLLRPLNFAGRVLHYGRYGRDSDDPRLGAVFAGYPWLMRGYDIESFTDQEINTSTGSVAVLDRILGSRIGITNLELRLPLLGPAGLVRTLVFPPIEAAAFFDAGVGWDDRVKPSFLGGSRDPVTSHGVAMRVNLFGIMIGEVDLVHPNDRPLKGWYWQFNLQPGF
jgi:hypothetical protein